MRTHQLRFPGTRPGFIRIEMEHQGELGWEVTVYEAETKRYVTAGDSTTYGFQSYEEAVEVVAACLDSLEVPG